MSCCEVRRAVTIVDAGPLTTVQDLGRSGQAAWGIGRSGACDRASAALANRLVGNRPGAAVLEVTLGGLALRAESNVVAVTTGARCPGSPHNAPAMLRAGTEMSLGRPESGLRTYLAIRGGIDVAEVLGSRSTDLLGQLGPDVVSAGHRLAIGEPENPMPGVDLAPVPDPPSGKAVVRIVPGPRRDWFSGDSWPRLLGQDYEVSADSNRVGVRLSGTPVVRERDDELPSEGMVRGAVQIPASGTPVVFLADHPVTGGYPVIGYVLDDDVDQCAQLRPGQLLRFVPGHTSM
jgi:biotin-dependent carboxylase-like uncharacterized protein